MEDSIIVHIVRHVIERPKWSDGHSCWVMDLPPEVEIPRRVDLRPGDRVNVFIAIGLTDGARGEG